jgi:hypothetical protein
LGDRTWVEEELDMKASSARVELPFAGEPIVLFWEELLATGALREPGVGGARVLKYVFMVKKTVTRALGGRSASFGSSCFLKRGKEGRVTKSSFVNMKELE